MPRRPIPVFVVSVGLALVLFTALRPAVAQPGPPAGAPPGEDNSPFPTVQLQPVTGATANGKLKLRVITLKTEVGGATIELAHVKRITFANDPEGKALDTVQLADRSLVRGRVTDEQLKLDLGSGADATWKRTDVREIKVLNEEPLSVLGIVLGLLTLTAMEIVLGVDNIIFLAIIAGKLPKEQQPKARKLGLTAALGTRLVLLFSLTYLLGLTAPLFTLPDLGFLHDMEAREISWRDLILLAGGAFLIAKSTFEMHKKVEEAKSASAATSPAAPGKPASFAWTIVTIAVIDIVFSLDSVITAIGMVEYLWVMVVAMVLAMLVMLYFAGRIAEFVDRHPTIRVLALSFLVLIGVMLVAEGLGQHIDKGYIYVAMGFALVVELINMKLRAPKKPKEAAKPPPPKAAGS
jgi:predicted tellurium resistance membrane protein TerC